MAGHDGTDVTDGGSGTASPVAALRSSPDRTVFTETGNADGWISTDLTVTLHR